MSLNTIRTQEIVSQKWRKMWKSAWRHVLKKTLRQRNKWRQQFDRGTLMALPKFQTRILHVFGQDF